VNARRLRDIVGSRTRHGHDEAGSFLPMTALLVTVIFGFSAFAVDLGTQRVAIRDMQAVADAVALDTARSLPTCNQSTLTTAANQSLARQETKIGTFGGLTVTPGHMDSVSHTFVPGTTGTCDAVKVAANTTVSFAFARVLGRNSGSATRSAVGTTSDPVMCFSAGTKAIVLNTSSSALGPVLDKILGVNLGVVGYSGLVDLQSLNVKLVDLNAQLIAGTGKGLVDTTTVKLSDLMVAEASVLRQYGNTAQATLLDSVAAQIASNVVVKLSDVLAVDTTGTSALQATVNALDLLGAATVGGVVQVGNGENALKISDLGIALTGLAATQANVTIIEPPKIACGKTGASATTAQVRVDIKADVLGALKLTSINLGVLVAKGTATLQSMACVTSTPTATVHGVTSAANVVGYGGTGSAGISILTLPLLNLSGQVGSGASDHTFTYPAVSGLPSPPTYTYGSSATLSLSVDTSGLNIIQQLLIVPLLNPTLNLVGGILTPVLNGVLGLLGIKLGAMDVSVLGRPACSNVRLAG
jgi:uncharacterized membrane protein